MDREHEEQGEREHDLGSLGSLAQSARLKHLNTARWLLIGIGILTILVNSILLATAREQLMNEIKKQNLVVVNQDEFEKGLTIVRLIYAVPLSLGVVFIILGLMVKSYPVPITILGLVLYVIAQLAFMILEPANIAQGLIIKIIIVVALVKAVQAAFAYQREMPDQLYEPD